MFLSQSETEKILQVFESFHSQKIREDLSYTLEMYRITGALLEKKEFQVPFVKKHLKFLFNQLEMVSMDPDLFDEVESSFFQSVAAVLSFLKEKGLLKKDHECCIPSSPHENFTCQVLPDHSLGGLSGLIPDTESARETEETANGDLQTEFSGLNLSREQTQEVRFFIEEAFLLLEEMDQALLHITEGKIYKEKIRILYRGIHSIKGTSAFFPFLKSTITDFCHELENFLSMILEEEIETLTENQLTCLTRLIRVLTLLFENLNGRIFNNLPPHKGFSLVPVFEAIRSLCRLEKADPENFLPFGAMALVPDPFVRIPFESMEKMTRETDSLRLAIGHLKHQLGPVHPLFREVMAMESTILSIQSAVIDFRLFPIETMVQRLQRQVKILAATLGKEVDFVLEGLETRIDKKLFDILMLPLTHILRNAVDHGIETPQKRVKSGKDPKGLITIVAKQNQERVIIEIIDDGAGLDLQKILLKAQEKGYAKKGASFSQKEIFQFLTMPGFTLSQEVSQISGRGIGLDVVRQEIEKSGGSFEIESTFGKGCVFRLIMRPSISLDSFLIVQTQEGKFCIRSTTIMEIYDFHSWLDLFDSHSSSILFQDQRIPLFLISGKKATSQDLPERGEILILSSEQKEKSRYFALLIYRCLGYEDIVIQPFNHPFLQGLGIFSAAAVLSDGTVSCILDMDGFLSFDQVT